MKFYTPKECEEWCQGMQISLDDTLRPLRKSTHQHHLRCNIPPAFARSLWFSGVIEKSLRPRQDCLLWVTQSEIWPSSENWHLYYRLRQSYGDLRLLDEAPGHFCLGYEVPEVVTLIHLSVLFGWDIHLIPTVGYGRAFICHDGWIEIGFDDAAGLGETQKAFEYENLTVTVVS